MKEQSPKFRFIDLFCGIGGFRIAFEKAGGECVFSSDWDKFSQITYEANFGHKPHGDIHSVAVKDIPSHDILCGGFPCQPFSLAGVSKKNSLGRKHGFQDEKQGNLFFSIAEILDYHKPAAFVLENVKNLKSHDGGRTFKIIYDTLTNALGYQVRYEIIDAQALVPQHRERIFLVGFKPSRTFDFPRFPEEGPKLSTILDKEIPAKYTLTDHLWKYLRDYAEKHRAAGNGFGFGLFSGKDVARTLSARYHKDGSEILISQGPGRNPRRLTPRECARLMGFPDNFKIPVSDTQAYRQFGNSVVVPVVEKIAEEVVKTLRRPSDYRSDLVLELNEDKDAEISPRKAKSVSYKTKRRKNDAMNLSSVFAAVAHKKLVAVDLPHEGSNQHELNGVVALMDFFGGAEIRKGGLSWHYFADDQEPHQSDGIFTFYDARAKSAARTGRSEWRFYYYGNFLSVAGVGDWFVLARTQSGRLFGLIFQKDSGWLRAAKALFGIEDTASTFDAISPSSLGNQQLELLRRQILMELELEVSLPVPANDEDLILKKFGRKFPTTKEMSAFARSQVEVNIHCADEALVRWLDREEQLFRALENVIIGERLAKGFASVDEFIEYSLSVQNRRKSRMGFALQNHLAELFTKHGLQFSAQAKTEANNKPDFIFPGEREYHNPAFDSTLLIMLGVKSTSKDRWRQVLTEADRIPAKHLCTLEAGISTKQTEEMHRQRLTLVIPSSLHATYTSEQRSELLAVGDFVDLVSRKLPRTV